MQAAALPKGSVDRLLLVTAFNISGWGGPATRTQYKAMRPMDFETYELVCPERGFKAVIEVVSSAPSGSHAEAVHAIGLHTLSDSWSPSTAAWEASRGLTLSC